MSATDLSPTPATQTPPPSSTPRRGSAGSWARVALACALLLGSAGVRWWQARRIERELDAGRRGPRMDLATIPLTLGDWQGEPTAIDPQIARGTGADQIVTRRYVNRSTGVAIEVILLYGPAVDMYLHAPEVCYPAAGFRLVSGPDNRPIPTPGGHPVVFRSLAYAKGEGASADTQEVYYSWWYRNHWTPDVGKQKHFERIPSMYKVHLARRVLENERRAVGNPCESLLQALLPEMERRMAETRLTAPESRGDLLPPGK